MRFSMFSMSRPEAEEAADKFTDSFCAFEAVLSGETEGVLLRLFFAGLGERKELAVDGRLYGSVRKRL